MQPRRRTSKTGSQFALRRSRRVSWPQPSLPFSQLQLVLCCRYCSCFAYLVSQLRNCWKSDTDGTFWRPRFVNRGVFCKCVDEEISRVFGRLVLLRCTLRMTPKGARVDGVLNSVLMCVCFCAGMAALVRLWTTRSRTKIPRSFPCCSKVALRLCRDFTGRAKRALSQKVP